MLADIVKVSENIYCKDGHLCGKFKGYDNACKLSVSSDIVATEVVKKCPFAVSHSVVKIDKDKNDASKGNYTYFFCMCKYNNI